MEENLKIEGLIVGGAVYSAVRSTGCWGCDLRAASMHGEEEEDECMFPTGWEGCCAMIGPARVWTYNHKLTAKLRKA